MAETPRGVFPRDQEITERRVRAAPVSGKSKALNGALDALLRRFCRGNSDRSNFLNFDFFPVSFQDLLEPK